MRGFEQDEHGYKRQDLALAGRMYWSRESSQPGTSARKSLSFRSLAMGVGPEWVCMPRDV